MNKTKIFLIIFFSSMGGMLYGYDIGIINSAMLYIAPDMKLSISQLSFLGGAVLYGGALAILFSGWLADKMGRKETIILAGFIFIVSVILIYFSDSYNILFISRMIQGIAVGFISVTVPLYLTESVPNNIRGLAVTSFQLMLTAGILISNYIGLLFSNSQDWRAMFLTALAPGLLVFIGGFYLVKSPRWLVTNNRNDEAEKVLNETLGCSTKAKEQITEINNLINNNNKEVGFSKIIKDKKSLKPIIIVFSIAILAQLTGINSILQFASTLLKEAGLGSDKISIIGGVAITGINFIATIFAVIMADRIERKYIITFGTFMVSVSLIFSGTALYLLPHSSLKGWVLLIGLIAYIIFFAIGPGAYIWVIMSELLPTSFRSKGLAIALFLNSLASALLASVFLTITESLGDGSMFYVCGLCTLVYCYIAYKYIPKTNGKSLEEIENSF